jgi:hypothetical protein
MEYPFRPFLLLVKIFRTLSFGEGRVRLLIFLIHIIQHIQIQLA